MRLEIAKALQREGVFVIPVLLGGARMPEATDLPNELESLARRNALELSDKRWDYDIDQLVESLVMTAGLTPVAKPSSPAGTRTRTMRLFATLGVILAVLIATLGYFIHVRTSPKNAFEVFSIDNPANSQEIPLGENQTRIVEGTLRVADGLRAESGTPNIEVEVFRLPEGDPVVPQPGKIRFSTEQGHWRFETARFSGEGRYEVLATVSLEGRTDFQKVIVKCIPKETAFQQAIEKDREIRGASALAIVQLNTNQLSELKRKLNKLQSEFFVLLRAGDLDGAEANVTRTLDLLDPVLPSHPNDWYLQNVRAYTFKNYALVMRKRGNVKESHRALAEAERMFEAIREQKPDDAGAWNGLGSVAMLKGDPERAMVYIDRALELNPNYKEAKHDRALAKKILKQKEKDSANRRP